MMRWILLGVLLAVLLLYPPLLALVVAAVAALLSKPVLVAFALGLTAGLRARRMRGWAR